MGLGEGRQLAQEVSTEISGPPGWWGGWGGPRSQLAAWGAASGHLKPKHSLDSCRTCVY